MMLRMPAVSGRFYPSDPAELTAFIKQHSLGDKNVVPVRAKACLVPHAGYVYSGHVAGAVYARIVIPKKVVILGVRHRPQGEKVAILSSGTWRTPLGDAPIDEPLATALREACPMLREDGVAHSAEHSLEVQVPFLQILQPGFTFVPIALGTVQFADLLTVGEALGRVLLGSTEEILLLTTSDLNHYENDVTTRAKDRQAIDRILALDPHGLYDICRKEEISMCGLGPTVAMLTALKNLGMVRPELVRYGTSGDVSGDFSTVVGYAGMLFSGLQEKT
jgi:AmmeMemoRadiSam system protein B